MLGTGLVLRYDRKPDFFRFLEFQSDAHWVFTGSSTPNSESVELVSTVSLRNGYMHGVLKRVGYLGDLRVHSSPRLTALWRKAYGDLLRQSASIEELEGCESFLTAVINENQGATRALVHPKRDFGYRYTALSPYRMVTLLGRVPGSRFFTPGEKRAYSWVRSTPKDRDELEAFLDAMGRTRPWGFVGKEELEHRLRAWPNFSIHSFWICRAKSGGRVLGAFAPWSPAPAKRILVDRFPRGTGPLLQIARALGVPVPRPGGELRLNYLTWLELDPSLPLTQRQSMLREGLRSYEESIRGDSSRSLVAFCDFDQEPLACGLRGYLMQETPMTLYAVSGSHQSEPPCPPGISKLRPPGFEMALV